MQFRMATAVNKQRVLTHVYTLLKNRYGLSTPEARPVLSQFVYALCREGATREQADRAFRYLHDRFFDWNEVRVTSARELEEALSDLPDAEQRAQRLISFLQEVFETTFSFDLEFLHKKGVKQATKQLLRYQAASDFVVAWVTLYTLGGHSIPLDGPILRVLRRLGLIDAHQEDGEALRASLEHLIPKVRGPLIGELVSGVADEFCWEDDPNCAACPLGTSCPTGQEAARSTVSSGRGTRPKPR
jgi:endonuclease III